MNQTTPFVGREKEIALFKQCFEAILPENADKPEYAHLPKVLSFYGAAGVGKTALKNKFLEIAQEMYPDVVLMSFFCAEKERFEFNDGSYGDISLKVLEITQNSQITGVYKSRIDTQTKQIESKEIYYAVQNIQFDFSQDNWEIDENEYNKTNKKNPSICIFEDINEDWSIYIQLLNNSNIIFLCVNTFSLFQDTNYQDISIISNEQFYFEQSDFEGKPYKLFVNFKETHLKPFDFIESKEFLNGFFSQFNDNYINKIYQYTQGYPENLKYLLDLVKENRFSAEAIIAQLIDNKGETLTKLQTADKNNENLTEKLIAVMTHNLNNKFASLMLDFDYLKKKLNKLEQDQELQDVLGSFYKGLRESADMFALTERYLQKQQPHLIETNLIHFLEKEIQPLAQNKNYTIEIVSKQSVIKLLLDYEAFKEATRNLLSNAEKHGFVQAGKEYRIQFECHIVQENEQDFVQILYKNNGKPFPQGFDFDSYILLSYASGKTKGSGIGGFWINKVIKLHKGKFRAIALHDAQAEFPVILEILLPIL